MNKSSIFLVGGTGRNKITQLPEFIYFDTSFWNEAIGISNSQYRRDCKGFIDYVLENNRYICTSNLVLGEMDHTVGNAFMINRARMQGIEIPKYNGGQPNMKALQDKLIEKDSNFVYDYKNQLLDIRNIIKSKSIFLDYDANEEFNDKAFSIREATDFKLGEKDSQHATICHNNNINSIATKDGDFWTLDNLNVYTVPKDEYKIKSIDRANVFLEFDENKY